MKTFVSIGECMLEFAPAAEEGLYGMAFSGDTFNTAWYARRALGSGWSVSYVTGVGQDPVSDRMLDFMGTSGIATDHVVRVPDRTVGLYLIELSGGERSFVYWRDQSAARALADDPVRLGRALAGADVVYFSGITLAILESAARANLLDAVTRARETGACIVFDPNLRPRLWPDRATMCDAITVAANRADIVLPSFDDEAAHFGDADPEATAARYGAGGSGVVVVKNGAGEMLIQADGARHRLAPQPAARIVDTTAAGDSFNAAFLASFFAGESPSDAARAGADLAARVIGGRGALVEE